MFIYDLIYVSIICYEVKLLHSIPLSLLLTIYFKDECAENFKKVNSMFLIKVCSNGFHLFNKASRIDRDLMYKHVGQSKVRQGEKRF